MRYFGIKTPDKPEVPSYIWWISDSEHGAWTEDKPEVPSYIWWISDSEHGAWTDFFSRPDKEKKHNAHTYPLADAIRAYEGIGYRCVELSIEVI